MAERNEAQQIQDAVRADGYRGQAAAAEVGRRIHQTVTDRERGTSSKR